MTKSSCITSTLHVHQAVPAEGIGHSGIAGKPWPRKLITCCVLFAFINLDVLYPMQQAMAAEQQSELQTAVRSAHVDVLGDALALAGQAARLQAQQGMRTEEAIRSACSVFSPKQKKLLTG